jgi:predicted ester cyclase
MPISRSFYAQSVLLSVRGRFRGEHKGPFLGNPPTGKSFDVPIYLTYRIAGGKIVDHWMLVDNALMMQQGHHLVALLLFVD